MAGSSSTTAMRRVMSVQSRAPVYGPTIAQPARTAAAAILLPQLIAAAPFFAPAAAALRAFNRVTDSSVRASDHPAGRLRFNARSEREIAMNIDHGTPGSTPAWSGPAHYRDLGRLLFEALAAGLIASLALVLAVLIATTTRTPDTPITPHAGQSAPTATGGQA